MFLEPYQFAVLAIATPLISMLFVPLVSAISQKLRDWFCVLIGFITAFFTLSLIPSITSGETFRYEWIPGLDVSIGVYLDALSVFVAVIAGVIGALVLLYSVKYMEEDAKEGYNLDRYYFLTLLFIGAMIGLALTDNLLVFYVFWEIVGFCSYALISYRYHDPAATRGGMKAFVVTRIGDAGFLVAVLALYLGTGTFSIRAIISAAINGAIPGHLLGIAGVGVIMGAIGKSAQMPLHVWLPDAMEAPTTTTALIHAATMVNAGIYLVARSYPIFSGLDWWLPAIAIIGGLTAFFTATMALAEKDIKRVLAYSTISQLGFMMAAVGVGSVLASSFHLFTHGIFKALLFLCAGAVIHSVGTRDMFKMGGLGKEMRLTNGCFLIGILALMGIPIFSGFWSKEMIMHSALNHNYVVFVLLLFAALATVGYSWRMYRLVFLSEKKEKTNAHDPPWQMSVPLVLLAIGSVIAWLILPRYSDWMLTVPYSNIEAVGFMSFVQESFLSPVIIVTLIVVVLLAALVAAKEKIEDTFVKDTGLNLTLKHAYGFDFAYSGIEDALAGLSKRVRRTQTGDINYNMFGIGIGLIIFIVLALVVYWWWF